MPSEPRRRPPAPWPSRSRRAPRHVAQTSVGGTAPGPATSSSSPRQSAEISPHTAKKNCLKKRRRRDAAQESRVTRAHPVPAPHSCSYPLGGFSGAHFFRSFYDMRAPLPLLCRRQRVTAAFMIQSKLRRSRFYSAFYRLRFQTSLRIFVAAAPAVET